MCAHTSSTWLYHSFIHSCLFRFDMDIGIGNAENEIDGKIEMMIDIERSQENVDKCRSKDRAT